MGPEEGCPSSGTFWPCAEFTPSTREEEVSRSFSYGARKLNICMWGAFLHKSQEPIAVECKGDGMISKHKTLLICSTGVCNT